MSGGENIFYSLGTDFKNAPGGVFFYFPLKFILFLKNI